MSMPVPDDSGRADDAGGQGGSSGLHRRTEGTSPSIRKVVPYEPKDSSNDRSGLVTVGATRGSGALLAQVEQVRASSGAPPAKFLRRLLFFWLRIYVHSTKRGKEERVNVAVPVPIPLLAILFPGRLTWNQALKVATLADDPERASEIGRYLESCMGLELVRVEQDNPEREQRELVVIGFD
jgi:hypothetical protein